jgi:hypothetical protein
MELMNHRNALDAQRGAGGLRPPLRGSCVAVRSGDVAGRGMGR